MYKKILLATDGSKRSAIAADHALEIARAGDAELQVISVVDSGKPREAYDIDPDFHAETEELTDVNVQELIDERSRPEHKFVDEIATRASEAGVSATTSVLLGDPHKEILNYAKEAGSDVIVMGSHGRGALASAMVGSVTSKIIHQGDIPVLVIPVHDA